MSVNKVTIYDQVYRRFAFQQRERERERDPVFTTVFVLSASSFLPDAHETGDKEVETQIQPITSA